MSNSDRRHFVKKATGVLMGALMATSLISGVAYAEDYPTAKVNTTGLAVTDDTAYRRHFAFSKRYYGN